MLVPESVFDEPNLTTSNEPAEFAMTKTASLLSDVNQLHEVIGIGIPTDKLPDEFNAAKLSGSLNCSE